MNKTLKIVNTALVLIFIVMFAMFAYQLVAKDPFDEGSNRFLLFGVMFVLILAIIAVNFVSSMLMRGRTIHHAPENTKECISCGHKMGVTEHSCPRCRVIQPSNCVS